ncbi:hypothetical protein BD311DRAFT_768024 [Dichomitus squalens]|uniref:Uncharacterized protein n=1 Tax=Dichomitus squalens TaxID=114155 RepID=A0A4Q9M997_9APHY|nr:hypothetical protein BD311DRAFT_768024 [Dichomitus squalens]
MENAERNAPSPIEDGIVPRDRQSKVIVAVRVQVVIPFSATQGSLALTTSAETTDVHRSQRHFMCGRIRETWKE